jgi:DNA-binding transcriptional LysR family regulator
LTELAILDALALGKTLSTIAAELYLGQPGVSKALRSAEQRSGLHLVEREGYRVRLTPTGTEVAHRAREALERVQDLNRYVEQLQTGAGGPVRLVTTATPGNSIVPEVVGAFGRRYPEAEIELRIAHRSELWETCARESYDIGFGPETNGLPTANDGWSVERLYQDRITFFVPPDHTLAGRLVALADLEPQRLVGPFAEPYWSDAWHKLEDLGFPATRRMTLLASEAVRRLVKAGGGVGMLLGLSILEEVADGALVPLRLEVQPPTVWYAMALPPHRRRLGILDSFQEFFREKVSSVQSRLASMTG